MEASTFSIARLAPFTRRILMRAPPCPTRSFAQAHSFICSSQESGK